MQALEIIRIKRFNLTIYGQKMHRYFLVEKTMLWKGIRLENLCCTFLPARCFSSATPPIIFRFRFAEVVLWKTLDFKKRSDKSEPMAKRFAPGPSNHHLQSNGDASTRHPGLTAMVVKPQQNIQWRKPQAESYTSIPCSICFLGKSPQLS